MLPDPRPHPCWTPCYLTMLATYAYVTLFCDSQLSAPCACLCSLPLSNSHFKSWGCSTGQLGLASAALRVQCRVLSTSAIDRS